MKATCVGSAAFPEQYPPRHAKTQSRQVAEHAKMAAEATAAMAAAKISDEPAAPASKSSHLAKQDLATMDPSKLNPLSPEVISRQATINIGELLPPLCNGLS